MGLPESDNTSITQEPTQSDARVMSSPNSPLALRHETRLFIRGCQHLLSALSFPGCQPLTEDERRLIEYYAEKLFRAMGVALKK